MLADEVGFSFALLRHMREGHAGLADYVHSSLTPAVASPSPPLSLFPMAPPYLWDRGRPPRDAAGRTSWRLCLAEELLVNLFVLA